MVRPISSIYHNDPCVSSMQFFPMTPPTPGDPAPDIPKFPIRLAVNFVDFGDCESSNFPLARLSLSLIIDSGIPKSTLAVYTVMANRAPAGVQWVSDQFPHGFIHLSSCLQVIRPENSRHFNDGPLAFVLPSANNTRLLAGVLNPSTAVTQLTPKAKGKEIPVGQLVMLNL